VVVVVADLGQDVVGEGGAEGLAFGVDLGVVAAGEVDAFEGTVARLARGVEGLDRVATVRLHDQRVAGRELVDVLLVHADDGHQRDAFGGDGDEVLGAGVPARADAVRVADDEAVAVADEPGDGVAAVPVLGGAAQDVADVHVLGDLRLHGGAFQALVLERLEQPVMLLVEPEADLLEDGLGVGRIDDVRAALRERGVELAGVGEVEVAGDEQVAGRPDGLARVRVAGDRVEAAGGAVAQVAEQELAAEVEVALHRLGELRDDDRLAHLVGVGLDLAGEDLGQALGADLAVAEEEGLAVLGPDLDAADARAVLAAVVLLLHQEEELVEAVQRGAVFLLIPLQVLGQPDKGNAAFVP